MNVCSNFVPNVFDTNKCQNCFKSKDNHAGIPVDNSQFQAVKKVVGCGYLFISPQGLDFRNLSDRSKRWQRRFFTLYDDGELLFSIDENSETIPQGQIRLSSCRGVHSGEAITGHANSLALHLDNGESYFLRAANREEMLYWERLLTAFSQVHPNNRSPGRFNKFPRSMSGPLPGKTQPQPPPRQQPPKKANQSPTTGTTRVSSKRGEYYETDLDYDVGSKRPAVMQRHYNSPPSSKSGGSPFSGGRSGDSRSRRRPMSVGDQLKSLIRDVRSPDDKANDGKELTYLKKGWLFTKGPNDPKLQKRWCVLSDGILALYRDTFAEEQRCPDFTLALFLERNKVSLSESADDLSYGFTLDTASGPFLFTAMTAGIRGNWIHALQTCLRLRPPVRRHTAAGSDLNSDSCDAEVTQILHKKSKMEDGRGNAVSDRVVSTSKASISSSVGRSSHPGSQTGSDRPGDLVDLYSRLADAESEATALRQRVSDLHSRLDVSESRAAELEARLSSRESECRDLSEQCQRLELDVVEREKLVALPTDDELKLKQQLAAHNEALRASEERCLRAERCVGAINDRLAESLSAADEELADAIQARETALRERTAAVDDRNAIDRRWKADRQHWEAALRQNEAENTRLAEEWRRSEAKLAAAVGAAKELEGLRTAVAAAVEAMRPLCGRQGAADGLEALKACCEAVVGETGPGADLAALVRRLVAEVDDPVHKCRQALLLSHCAAKMGGRGEVESVRKLLQPAEVQKTGCPGQDALFSVSLGAMVDSEEAASAVAGVLRRHCRRHVASLLRHVVLTAEDAVLPEDRPLAVSHLLLAAASSGLARCVEAVGGQHVARTAEEVQAALPGLVERLVREADGVEGDGEMEEALNNLPTMLVALAVVQEEEEEEEEMTETPKFSPITRADWDEMRRGAALMAQLGPLRQRLTDTETALTALRRETSAKDEQVAVLTETCRQKEEELRAMKVQLTDAREVAQVVEKDRRSSVSRSTNTVNLEIPNLSPPVAISNGDDSKETNEAPTENSLEYWKNELKRMLADELQSNWDSDVRSLQAKLEDEREAHRQEMESARRQFEAALEEETQATRIAIEAIERNFKEKLEAERLQMERRRKSDQKVDQTPRHWLSNSPTVENRLTLLAKRIVNLPSTSNESRV